VLLLFSQDLEIIDRQTYSSLELLGDVGGLFDALETIGFFLSGPISTFFI